MVRRNKYNAHKITIDGIKFDSKKEANRYCELKILEKAQIISETKKGNCIGKRMQGNHQQVKGLRDVFKGEEHMNENIMYWRDVRSGKPSDEKIVIGLLKPQFVWDDLPVYDCQRMAFEEYSEMQIFSLGIYNHNRLHF